MMVVALLSLLPVEDASPLQRDPRTYHVPVPGGLPGGNRWLRDVQRGRIVLKIVDQKTKDVVAEVPTDYALQLAQDLQQPDYLVKLSQELKKGTG